MTLKFVSVLNTPYSYGGHPSRALVTGCLTLFYYEDKSITEVAAMLGLPEGTVKTHLHRARKLLRAAFQQRGLDDLALWL